LGVADVPTKLGPDILIKTVLPGLVILAIFFEPIIYPLINEFWNSLEKFGDKLLIWFLASFVIGFLFMLCDTYIYWILEGRRLWPSPLWKFKYWLMEKYFKNLETKLKSSVDQRDRKTKEMSPMKSRKLSLKIVKLGDRVREFPPDNNKSSYTGRYPKQPTRLGNVLYEYESYSKERYGINLEVFWNHIIQFVPRILNKSSN
jgi:hypothetical protein